MGMGKFRRRWIVNILRMQAIIVCAFFLICGITPLAVIADYVDDVSRTSLRTMDESMLESLRYAQQTIRFLAQSDGVSAQAAAYLDEAGSMQARQKAQVELRRHLVRLEGACLPRREQVDVIRVVQHAELVFAVRLLHERVRRVVAQAGHVGGIHLRERERPVGGHLFPHAIGVQHALVRDGLLLLMRDGGGAGQHLVGVRCRPRP